MDDVLVLAPTRWKLRAAVRTVNRVLAPLDLEKHPDKTFIGRGEKGFDWLGYHLWPGGLRPAAQTMRNFAARVPATRGCRSTWGVRAAGGMGDVSTARREVPFSAR